MQAHSLLFLATVVATKLFAQQGGAPLRFEVASVKPTISLSELNRQNLEARLAGTPLPPQSRRVSGLRLNIGGETIKSMVSWAYGADVQLIEGPGWVIQGEDLYEIQAKLPAGSTKDDIPAMLRQLLQERFHLAVHRAAAEQAGFAITVSQRGPRLKPAREMDDAPCPEDEWRGGMAGVRICRRDQTINDKLVMISWTLGGVLGPAFHRYILGGEDTHDEYCRITMANLAGIVQNALPHGDKSGMGPTTVPTVPIVDRTGIPGEFDMVLEWRSKEEVIPSIKSSLEKYGLTLQAIKVPTEKLVIDHVDRVPTAN